MIDFQHPPDQTDPTRERIVRAAKEKYLRHGFARVPIEEICHDLRIAKKTFYKHFRNRDDLVAAVVADFFFSVSPHVLEIFQSDQPASEVIHEWWAFIATELPRHLSTEFLTDLETHLPELSEQIRQTRAAALSNIKQVVERGVREGSIHPEINPKVFAACFVEMVNAIARGSFLREHDITLTGVLSVFRRIFETGLKPTEEQDA